MDKEEFIKELNERAAEIQAAYPELFIRARRGDAVYATQDGRLVTANETPIGIMKPKGGDDGHDTNNLKPTGR